MSVPTGGEKLVYSKTWKVNSTHTGSYTGGQLCVSNDESFLACWNNQGVSLLDIATGQVTRTIEEDKDGFSSLCLAPDDDSVLYTTSSRSMLIRKYSTKTGEQEAAWKGHDLPITDIVTDWSGGGKLLATAASDRTVRVWNPHKHYCSHVFRGHEGLILKLAFVPSNTKASLQLVSCASDGNIFVHDLLSKESKPLKHHYSAVTSVCFGNGGTTMVSAGRDKVLGVWDMSSCALVKTVLANEQLEAVLALPSSVPVHNSKGQVSDGEHFVTGGSNGVLRVWSMSTFKCVASHALPTQQGEDNSELGGISRLLFLPTHGASGIVVAVTAEHNFFFLDPTAAFRQDRLLLGFNDEVLDVKCLPNNKQALVATNSAHVRVMGLEGWDAQLLVGHTDVVLAVDCSSDGQWACSSSKDNTVRVWHLPSRTCVAVGQGHSESVGCVGFSTSAHIQVGSKAMFVVSGSRDRTLKLWNCSALGKWKIGNSMVGVQVGATVLAHDKEINCVAVAPNDALVASGSQDRTIKLWQAPGLEAVATLKGHRRGVWALQFSPVDKVLVSSSGDKTIKIWSVTDHTCLRTFQGHTATVLRVSFLNKGMQLVSAGADAVVKLWNIKNGECVNSFDSAHEEKIWAMSLTKDQTRLVTGGLDSTLNIWTDITAEEEEEALKHKQHRAQKEQKLSNSLRKQRYCEAVALCIELDQPRKLF
eukprot:CAMPEP_0175148638 /NCGR_PEP_ID=MMETSP0087-20121206/16750_1 /TAXON_ID=136419 /ORGANISM="Unknown Unknown, Strain D1" /LENGTH=700 /DNA_ID=CAMNT_0016434143 /DNA_START=49 /DNA_END=2147 /DNA_ORIENTATION=-